MKKLLLLIIPAVFGCKNNPDVYKNEGIQIDSIHASYNADMPVYLYTIDSCEYIGKVNFEYSDYLTHKGNCKFCKQRLITKTVTK